MINITIPYINNARVTEESNIPTIKPKFVMRRNESWAAKGTVVLRDDNFSFINDALPTDRLSSIAWRGTPTKRTPLRCLKRVTCTANLRYAWRCPALYAKSLAAQVTCFRHPNYITRLNNIEGAQNWKLIKGFLVETVVILCS